jgi:hypothetical protein
MILDQIISFYIIGKTGLFSLKGNFYTRVYLVYRRVYILLCYSCCSWEAFNQTGQYIVRQLIKHDQT